MDALTKILSHVSISLDLSTLGLLIVGLFWKRQIVYGRKQQVLEQTYIAFMKLYDFLINLRATFAYDNAADLKSKDRRKEMAAYQFKRLSENSHRTITPFLANRYAFSLYFKDDHLFEEALGLWSEFKDACQALQTSTDSLANGVRTTLEKQAGLVSIDAYNLDADPLVRRLNAIKSRFDSLLAQYL